MDDKGQLIMEPLYRRSPNEFFSIKEKISEWDFSELHGIGFKRGHDKYACLELKVHDQEKYLLKENQQLTFSGSYVHWNIDPNNFPLDLYEYGKKELLTQAQFVSDLFSVLKGKEVSLIFELIFAGYHPSDVWGRGAVGNAFNAAVLSCFEPQLLKQGLIRKQNDHRFNSGKYTPH